MILSVVQNVGIVRSKQKNYADSSKSPILCMKDENTLNKVMIIESRNQEKDKFLPLAKKSDLVSML